MAQSIINSLSFLPMGSDSAGVGNPGLSNCEERSRGDLCASYGTDPRHAYFDNRIDPAGSDYSAVRTDGSRVDAPLEAFF